MFVKIWNIVLSHISTVQRVRELEQEYENMTASLTDLNNSVTNLNATQQSLSVIVTTLQADWATLLSALPAPDPSGIDYSAQVASINNVITALSAATTSLTSVDSAVNAESTAFSPPAAPPTAPSS